MKVLIKNCSPDPRSIYKYMTYCSLYFNPDQEIEVECNSEKEVEYYKRYSSTGFKVMATADEIHVHRTTTATSPQEVVQSSKLVSEEIPTTEETNISNTTNRDADSESATSSDDGLDDLTISELKTIIENLGLTTNYRAAWKLAQLIRSNIPDGKTYQDYLK